METQHHNSNSIENRFPVTWQWLEMQILVAAVQPWTKIEFTLSVGRLKFK